MSALFWMVRVGAAPMTMTAPSELPVKVLSLTVIVPALACRPVALPEKVTVLSVWVPAPLMLTP